MVRFHPTLRRALWAESGGLASRDPAPQTKQLLSRATGSHRRLFPGRHRRGRNRTVELQLQPSVLAPPASSCVFAQCARGCAFVRGLSSRVLCVIILCSFMYPEGYYNCTQHAWYFFGIFVFCRGSVGSPTGRRRLRPRWRRSQRKRGTWSRPQGGSVPEHLCRESSRVRRR